MNRSLSPEGLVADASDPAVELAVTVGETAPETRAEDQLNEVAPNNLFKRLDQGALECSECSVMLSAAFQASYTVTSSSRSTSAGVQVAEPWQPSRIVDIAGV